MYNEKESIQNSTKINKRDVNNVAKHTIRILNYNLTLTSDDDKSYIDSVAQRVERNIKTLSDNMPTRNMTEVALFVAMDYCDRYMKSIGDGTAMRGQIKDYLKDSSFTRSQLEEAKKENELLKAENEKLRERLSSVSERENAKEKEQRQEYSVPSPAPTSAKTDAGEKTERPEKNEKPVKASFEKESGFARKKSGSKGKKKGNKPETAPVKGFFSEDDESESADAAADIMSFFEEKSFEDD